MPICSICGEESHTTKCKMCGEKFCSDCGEPEERLCLYCLDDEDDEWDDEEEDVWEDLEDVEDNSYN